ncbi:MAG: flagellar motor switch protein FliN [Acidobacteriota bacterium]
MASQDTAILWRQFASEFVQEMMGAVTRAAGRSWKASEIHGHSPESQSGVVWVDLVFAGSLAGRCQLGFSLADLDTLAPHTTVAGKEDADKTDQVQGLAPAIAAVAPELAAAGCKAYGSFTVSVAKADGHHAGLGTSLAIRLHDDRMQAITVLACASAELIESLDRPEGEEQGVGGESISRARPGSPASLFADAPNLEVLMDVELDVTLRFGQRNLTLREVLELTSGSVIELDRQVEEPVELILDGKVIARGEAVVIDGNYGLRVTEVPHPFSVRQIRV